jgi:hypothetical protein
VCLVSLFFLSFLWTSFYLIVGAPICVTIEWKRGREGLLMKILWGCLFRKRRNLIETQEVAQIDLLSMLSKVTWPQPLLTQGHKGRG